MLIMCWKICLELCLVYSFLVVEIINKNINNLTIRMAVFESLYGNNDILLCVGQSRVEPC